VGVETLTMETCSSAIVYGVRVGANPGRAGMVCLRVGLHFDVNSFQTFIHDQVRVQNCIMCARFMCVVCFAFTKCFLHCVCVCVCVCGRARVWFAKPTGDARSCAPVDWCALVFSANLTHSRALLL
jgi:hypothetical protein